MPLSKKAFSEKEDNLNCIHHLLYREKKGEIIKKDFMAPVFVEPTVYLTIYTEIGEDPVNYKRGYVIELDKRTNKAFSARYFISEGPDTYTEVALTSKQFKDIVEYYKINSMDIWYMLHKKVG